MTTTLLDTAPGTHPASGTYTITGVYLYVSGNSSIPWSVPISDNHEIIGTITQANETTWQILDDDGTTLAEITGVYQVAADPDHPAGPHTHLRGWIDHDGARRWGTWIVEA